MESREVTDDASAHVLGAMLDELERNSSSFLSDVPLTIS